MQILLLIAVVVAIIAHQLCMSAQANVKSLIANKMSAINYRQLNAFAMRKVKENRKSNYVTAKQQYKHNGLANVRFVKLEI